MTRPGAASQEALRVALDDEIFIHQSHGGISRYFCEIARRIARLPGYRVHVLAPLHSNEHLRRSPVSTWGLYLPRARGLSRVQWALGRAAWPLLRGVAAPHVIHRTYYSCRERPSGAARVVVTVHDMAHERLPALFPGDDTSRRKRAAVAGADHVICVSESTRRDLVECFGVPLERTSVVHLGCDAAGLRDAPQTPSPARPFVLYVGPRAGYKNFDALLQAFAASRGLARDFDLVAFGGSEWSAAEAARVRALALPAESVRRVPGNDATLAALYRQASALALPSLHEGFGIPLVEAMSFGCPVACSDRASLPEIAGEAARYFDPRDPDAIARALEEVLGSTTLRAALREKGLARAAGFSWDRTAARTAEVYARVANG